MKTFFQFREQLNEGLIDKAKGFLANRQAHKQLAKDLQSTIDHHKSESDYHRKRELHHNKSNDDRATEHASKGDVHKKMASHAQAALDAHKKNDHAGVKKHMNNYKSLTRDHVKPKDHIGQMGAAAHPRLSSNANSLHVVSKTVGTKLREDSDAVKAFLAKGGKIKKLPPAKAQGYHGKDDPGKGMHGMLDKPDTKKIGTRKKVKSMEAFEENYQVNESIADHEDAANAHQMAANSPRQDLRAKKAHMSAASHHMDAIKHLNKGDRASAAMSHRAAKSQSKIARRHGNKISHSAHADTHAIRTESYNAIDEELQVYRVGHKSVGGNVHGKSHDDAMAKLRAKGVKGKITLTHRGPANKVIPNHSKTGKPMASSNENYQVQKYTNGKKDGPAKSFGGNLKKATAHASKMGGDHRVHKEGYGGTSFSMKAMSKMKPQEKEKPPFNNAKPINKDPKDKFGNPIKNRAKHLARKAARDLLNKAK